MAPLSPQDYLTKVIALIQKRSIRSSKVDWNSLKTKTFEMIEGANSTENTYVAINYVLSQLADNHSFLRSRTGAGTNPYSAERIPLRPHKRVRAPQKLESNGKQFGFVSVCSLSAGRESKAAKTFAASLQNEISAVAQQFPNGWIVDLRGNSGGNLWPMIVGVGPLIGSATLGFFEYPDTKIGWFYENGEAGVFNKRGRCVNFRLEKSIPDLQARPIAVLIDGATASSGEALAISFKGRPSTLFIGSRTRGVATNNERIKLPDGATLFLTTSGEADRNYVSYESGIFPDIPVEQDETPFGGKDDPGIKAALRWLHSNV